MVPCCSYVFVVQSGILMHHSCFVPLSLQVAASPMAVRQAMLKSCCAAPAARAALLTGAESSCLELHGAEFQPPKPLYRGLQVLWQILQMSETFSAALHAVKTTTM